MKRGKNIILSAKEKYAYMNFLETLGGNHISLNKETNPKDLFFFVNYAHF